MKKLIMGFLKDEDGQTSTEYILLVAVAAMIVIRFGKKAGGLIDELTGRVQDKSLGFIDEIDAQ